MRDHRQQCVEQTLRPRHSFILLLLYWFAVPGCGQIVGPSSVRITYVPDGPVPAGSVVQIRAFPSDGVEWSSSDTTVASISERGVLWARRPGTVVITVRRSGSSDVATITAGSRADGKIVFRRGSEIRAVRLDGVGETVVLKYPAIPGQSGTLFLGDVSPDGDRIAFFWQDATGSGIYVSRLDGSEVTKVGGEGGWPLQFTADGKRIIFQSHGLREVDLQTNTVRTLWDEEPPRPDGGRLTRIGAFALSADMKLIYFAGTTEGFPHDPGLGALQSVDSLYSANIDDIRGTRNVLAPELGRKYPPITGAIPPSEIVIISRITVDPQGKRLLVSHSRGLFRVDLPGPGQGATFEPIDLPRGAAWEPAFAPDGSSRIVGVKTQFSEVDEGISIVDLTSRRVSSIIQRIDNYSYPIWAR
jgi:hypothetical protein